MAQSIRTIHALRQWNRVPVLRAVCGFVKRAVTATDASIFRPARHDYVQGAVRGERTPRKRLFLGIPLFFSVQDFPPSMLL